MDFDAKIAERGGFLEARDLNRYFYDALQRLLNITSSTYVTGWRIWLHELPWETRRVTRPGYVFFSAPDERSTAQPPRDFYLYFMPPFDSHQQRSGNEPDEVVLALDGIDAEFTELVRRYAGAQAMAGESPAHRGAYTDKANEHLRALLRWLNQHFTDRLRVTYRGKTRPVAAVLAQTRSSASRDPAELINVLAAHLLEPHFAERYPDYPAFTRLNKAITEEGRKAAAEDAVQMLARGRRTALAVGVLDGLGLLDDAERIRPGNSPYARHFLEVLTGRGSTQVVNHDEVIVQVAGEPKPVYKDSRFHLEPEWVAVVLLALVYDGQISLTVSLGTNNTLDAANIERTSMMPIADLADFRSYRRPRALPEQTWGAIFEAFGLSAGLVRDEQHRDKGVTDLQERVGRELNQVVTWLGQVQSGLTLWNQSLYTEGMTFTDTRDGVVVGAVPSTVPLRRSDLEPYLRQTKTFLEHLTRYTTAGKLRNLTLAPEEVTTALADRDRARRVQTLLEVLAQLQPITAYLSTAGVVLPEGDGWVRQAGIVREELLIEVRRLARDGTPLDLVGWRQRLDQLRREYVVRYSDLHRRDVLDKGQDDRRLRLLRDPLVAQLQALARIDILSNSAELPRWTRAVTELPVCVEFHEGLLADGPVCPRCHYRPAAMVEAPPAAQRLEMLARQLDQLARGWHGALHSALVDSGTAQASLAAMTAAEREPITVYLALPDPTTVPLPSGLVEAANGALRGLHTIALSHQALAAALEAGGLPCTVKQLQERFLGYLNQVLRGQDAGTTRLTFGHDAVEEVHV